MSTKSKGNILETVVEMLERSLSDESTIISKNKKIKDLDGITREIDIYIEAVLNKRKFTIAIECKHYNEKSRIEMDKIGAFYEKCSRLPFINKMIFLTTSDYQKGAIEKARSRNIELYKISTEVISEEKDKGIKDVSIIEKKLKILKIRFNSAKLFKDKVYTNDKLKLYDHKKKLIEYEELNQRVSELEEIWRFLNTKSGLLFNHKKIIYPNVSTKEIYTNYKGTYYPVDLIQFTIEIEYIYKTLDFGNVNKYESLTEGKTFAIFNDIEFIVKGIKHRFCYIKPLDETEERFFISENNSLKVEELKVLHTFKSEPKLILNNINKLQNFKVKPYQFEMTEGAIKNSLKNVQMSTGSGLNKNLYSKKSSLLVGIDEINKKLFFMIPLAHNKKLISAKFPDPISLYFNHAIDLYNKSLLYKNTMIENAPEDASLLLQDGNYHKFLQYSVSSILILNSTIELFINSNIDDSFTVDIDGKKFGKKEIEKELSLSEKLIEIVPLISAFKISSNKKILNNILELNELNNELQNLKTSSSINQPFLNTFERLLKFNMGDCCEATKILFYKINKNYTLIE